jgi:hypothetical protein
VRSFLFFDKTKHLQDLQAACIKTARRKMGKLRGCHTILVRQPLFSFTLKLLQQYVESEIDRREVIKRKNIMRKLRKFPRRRKRRDIPQHGR